MSMVKQYRKLLRKHMNRVNRSRLKNGDFSVICSNCVGSVMLSELGQRFNSPTVNLFFYPSDFLKFCGNIEHYLAAPLKEDFSVQKPYPVGILDDIRIMFKHYPDYETAYKKWIERRNRVNFNNLFFMMSERDGCTKADIESFDRLPFKNKVIFTSQDYPEFKSAYHIPGTETRRGVLLTCVDTKEY